METSSFFLAIGLLAFVVSTTAYSIYVSFGQPSQQLRDPFEEHED